MVKKEAYMFKILHALELLFVNWFSWQEGGIVSVLGTCSQVHNKRGGSQIKRGDFKDFENY